MGITRNKVNVKAVFFVLIISPFIYILVSTAVVSLLVDIELYNSFGTRLGLIISSIKISLFYPFGVGFWGYYMIGPEYITHTADGLPLNVSELYSIADGENYSFKSTLSDFLVVYGVVPTFLCFYFILRGIRNSLHNRYMVLLIVFSIIILSASIPSIGYYFCLLPFIVYFQVYRRF